VPDKKEEDAAWKAQEKKFRIATMPESCWREFMLILQDLR